MKPIEIYPDKFKGEDAPKPDNIVTRWSYFYIHGALERMSGYDCFDSIGDKPSPGTYEAVVMWPDGTRTPARLFVRLSLDPRDVMAGIAVDPTNDEDLQWATEWYELPGSKGGNY